MTQKEIYTYGYIQGYLTAILEAREIDYDRSGFKAGQAAAYPLRAFAQIHAAASRERVLTDDVTRRLADLVSNIRTVDDGPEQCQPLEMQGSWQLGYYHGKDGRPYPDTPNIAALRKAKGLTQKQLAEMVGCDQAVISRVEGGKGGEDWVKKITETLNNC